MGWVGTICSWFLLVRIGRRPLFVYGIAGLAVFMFIIGILDCIPGRPSGVTWAESSLMLVWNFAYDLTIGPVCFVLISECSATRVRSKSIAVATAAQAVLGIIMTVAIPYMINPDQANMKGKLGFFYGGLGIFCAIWSYYRVPETMGRTYGELSPPLPTKASWFHFLTKYPFPYTNSLDIEELDLLFDKKIPARKFKGYRIDSAIAAEHEH